MSSDVIFEGVFLTKDNDGRITTESHKVAVDLSIEYVPTDFADFFFDVKSFHKDEETFHDIPLVDRTWDGESYSDVTDVIMDFPEFFVITSPKDTELDLKDLVNVIDIFHLQNLHQINNTSYQ